MTEILLASSNPDNGTGRLPESAAESAPGISDQTISRIRQAIALLCPDWIASDVAIETYLSGGYSNQNYRLRYQQDRYVLRIASKPSQAAFQRELRRLEALSQIFPDKSAMQPVHVPEVHVPEVVASYPPQALLLTRWSNATLLSDVPNAHAESLGTYLAKLHLSLERLGPEHVGPNKLAERIADDLLTAFNSPVWAAAQQAQLPQVTHELTPCHLDLNPWNLLRENNRWITLDWETLAFADPLFDLVSLCDGYLREHSETPCTLDQLKEFSCTALDAYERIPQIPNGTYSPLDLEQARIYYEWREYAWAAAQIAQGNTRPEVALQQAVFGTRLTERGFDIVPG